MTYVAMFHHFCNHKHPKGQGAISGEEFGEIIDFLDTNYILLDAKDFYQKLRNNTLSEKHSCLTFDDALKCQIDVAVPILRERGISAYFFVYGSAFSEHPDELEFYRDFRTRFFPTVDDFYASFFQMFVDVYEDLHRQYILSYPDDYLKDFPFYTEMDRRFRFARDKILFEGQYADIMSSMMKAQNYSRSDRREDLFMSEDDLIKIADIGHVVGMHSTTHPTQIDQLDPPKQREEYATNFRFLEDLLGQKTWCMSHPCGRYNSATLNILRDLGIELGFRSSLIGGGASNLEVPREDHTNILNRIRNQ